MSIDSFPLQDSNNPVDITFSQISEQWQQRLRLFREAEESLQSAKRLMTVWLVVVISGFCVLSFSLFVAPVTSVWLFAGGMAAFATGCIAQPVCLLWVKEQRQHRDSLSKRFYISNHEVEVTDSHLVLINRGNYAAVTQIPILEQ